jgi:predicted RNA-binding protein (virulence factor B family)
MTEEEVKAKVYRYIGSIVNSEHNIATAILVREVRKARARGTWIAEVVVSIIREIDFTNSCDATEEEATAELYKYISTIVNTQHGQSVCISINRMIKGTKGNEWIASVEVTMIQSYAFNN